MGYVPGMVATGLSISTKEVSGYYLMRHAGDMLWWIAGQSDRITNLAMRIAIR